MAQLANGRKTFAKTGTHEDQLVTTGGFIPNQIATFVLVGDVQNPVGHPIANIAINGPVPQLLGWFHHRGPGMA